MDEPTLREFYNEAVRTLEQRNAEIERLRAAADRVCWFDWTGNDEDAVRAVDDLRKALNHQQSEDR